VLAAVALLATACGSTERGTPTQPAPATGAAACITDSAVSASKPLLPVDLDGSARPNGVNFVPGPGACGNLLLATLDGRLRALVTPIDLARPRVKMHAVTVPGRRGQLLLAVDHHPRGGFQAYLFGYADGSLQQLTVRGRPVIPFVATDTGTGQLATHCTRNGIQVDTATQHDGAWTVYRSTYRLVGNQLSDKGRRVQVSGLTEAKLDQQYGALIRHDLFEDCT
jgi:hypothetical protein